MAGAHKIREASCWAHLRRDSHDEWTSSKSPIALEAINRIGVLYDIERRITGCSAQERLGCPARRKQAGCRRIQALRRGSAPAYLGKSDVTKALRYALKRWASFTLLLDDGRVAIDNNPAERAIRPIAVGRKKFLFAGSDAGGETLADAMTIIETAKLHSLKPQAYHADILGRINHHKINALGELLPWNWRPADTRPIVAAA